MLRSAGSQIIKGHHLDSDVRTIMYSGM